MGAVVTGKTDEPKTPPVPRIRKRPSRWVLATVAGLGGAIDGLMIRSSGLSATKIVLSMLFMAVFLYFGLTFVTALRFRYRPESVDVDQVDQQDSSLPPQAGGWANPTGGQRFTQRLMRAWKSTRRS
jgi:hypothetical protein